MGTNPIALTKGQRNQIFTLQDISKLSARTQERLTSGREVNSISDNAMVFFQARSISERAEDFLIRKDKIDQGVSTLTTALQGMDAIEDLLMQMKGIAEATKSQTTTERASATNQFQEIGNQISKLVDDTSYAGINLLTKVNTQLDVVFSNRTTSRLEVKGFDFNSTSAGDPRALFTTAGFQANGDMAAFSVVMGDAAIINYSNGTTQPTSGFSAIGEHNTGLAMAEQIIKALDDVISRNRAAAEEMASSVNILKIRLDYTGDYTDNLSVGSDKLTLADLNEEGANMVALQTRYEIGLEALSVSGDQQRQIVRLIQ